MLSCSGGTGGAGLQYYTVIMAQNFANRARASGEATARLEPALARFRLNVFQFLQHFICNG
jgi:hypothetical protein